MNISAIDNVHTEAEPSIIETHQTNDRLGNLYAFECSEYFHLAELVPVCSLIYGLAFKVSKRGESTFRASADNVAEYLNRSAASVRRGLRQLEKLGFLELEYRAKFRPNVYRVLSHRDWIVAHPGQCCSKLTFPYTEEGDALGRELWNIASGRIQFQKFQIDSYRRLGIPEDTISDAFREFWESSGKTMPERDVSPTFYKFLESRSNAEQN